MGRGRPRGVINFASAAEWGPALEKLNQAGVGLVAMKVMARVGRGRGASGPPRPANFAPAALKWVIKNPAIATTVPSMTDIDQLEQNFSVMAQQFTDADQKILTARLEEITPYFCRMCGQCEGQCTKGLPVGDMARFVMYPDGYGQFPLAGSTSCACRPSTKPCDATGARPASSSARTE